MKKRNNWTEIKNCKTEEEKAKWIKNFCDKHGIISPRQLCVKYQGIYKYYAKLSKENKEKIFPAKHRSWVELKNLKTEEEKAEWILNFCNKHGITSPRQLCIEYRVVYNYYVKLSKENKEKIFLPKYKNWSELRNLKTEEERTKGIKTFCNRNNITSPKQLCQYGGIWLIYRDLSKENREKIFSPAISRGEETLGRLLTGAGYIFITQKKYPDLRSNKDWPLFYDVFIPRKNCLIEFHGVQHFNPNVQYYDKEMIEHDRIKYQYAIDHGITIIYITDCIEAYKKYGYFAPVLIDWDELIENINSLPDVIVDAEDTAQN